MSGLQQQRATTVNAVAKIPVMLYSNAIVAALSCPPVTAVVVLARHSTRYSSTAQCGAFNSGRSNPAGFFLRDPRATPARFASGNKLPIVSAQPGAEIVEWAKEFLLKP